MKVVETWQTERQDDSAVGLAQLDKAVAHLRVLTGKPPHAIHIVPSKGVSIGRIGGECDVLVNDGRMSRKHARIERGISGWCLQDLMSRNAGFVDGRPHGRGGRESLPDGALIRLGDTLMVFREATPTQDGRPDSTVFPGVSPKAVALRRRIDALAAGSGHVLILGETGTGKERVAQALGQHRTQQPFVTLNSAELSRDLARSELFGHARGSFTNALANKPGLIEKAGDGVLFLDEIGELAIDVQAELLRFLEDGTYRPIGSVDLRHSNARVVAATHVDLDQAVHSGRFRRDLLARLRASNVPVELPALRERREDVLGWTQLFFRELQHDPGPNPWTVGALECLLLYPWDENLRGLRSVIRQIIDQAPTFPCASENLPVLLRAHRGTLRAPASGILDEPTPQAMHKGGAAAAAAAASAAAAAALAAAGPSPAPGLPNAGKLAASGNHEVSAAPEPTKAEIEEALRAVQGRVRAAAIRLGVDRRKFYRLCERYAIDIEGYRGERNERSREDE